MADALSNSQIFALCEKELLEVWILQQNFCNDHVKRGLDAIPRGDCVALHTTGSEPILSEPPGWRWNPLSKMLLYDHFRELWIF
jgi:hypothetical protein